MANYLDLSSTFLNYLKKMRSSMEPNSPALKQATLILEKQIGLLTNLQARGQTILSQLHLSKRKGAASAFKNVFYNFEPIEESKEKILQQALINNQQETKKVLLESYALVMKLREAITGEKVEYSIGDVKTQRSFVVDESIVYEQSTISTSLKYINGVAEDFDISIRLNSRQILDKQAETKSVTGNLSGTSGSTLWSRGVRILKILRSYYNNRKNKPEGIGLNFGHFYEAYLYFGGNANNFINNYNNPSNLTYAAYMLALANSRGFQLGGDIDNLQAKINQASLISLKKLINELRRLYAIFSNNINNTAKVISLLEKHFVQSDIPHYLEDRARNAEQELYDILPDYIRRKIWLVR